MEIEDGPQTGQDGLSIKRPGPIWRILRAISILFALLIAQFAPAAAAKWLVRWLSNSCEDTRTMASMALIRVGSPAVPSIVAAAQGGTVNRIEAVELLAQLALPYQIERIQSLDDDSEEIRVAIDEAVSFVRERAS